MWLWLILSFAAGVYFGMMVLAVCEMAGKGEDK